MVPDLKKWPILLGRQCVCVCVCLEDSYQLICVEFNKDLIVVNEREEDRFSYLSIKKMSERERERRSEIWLLVSDVIRG